MMGKDEIYRRIDETGRICLPKDMRSRLGIQADDVIRITVSESAITLRPHTASCVRCQSKTALVEVTRGVCLCRACVKALAAEEEEREELEVRN